MLLSLVVLAAVVGVPERDKSGLPHLRSESVMIRLADTEEVVLQKNARLVRPIASVTKLISALVIAKDQLAPAEQVTIEEADKDRLKWSRSRLPIGAEYAGTDLFRAALVASDNRAMYAVVRGTGVPRPEFVERMNRLAQELGMADSQFRDPAGIDPGNVSTAADLLRLVNAAAKEPSIAETTRLSEVDLESPRRGTLRLPNTNRLARSGRWRVLLGKTGYTVEAGRSLVLRVEIGGRPVDMVFLGSREMASIFGDAGRVRRWLEERLALSGSGGKRGSTSS